MTSNEWRIRVGEEETRALFEPGTARSAGVLFVCAHGAGGHMDDRGMQAIAQQFRGRGFDMLRFNFLYREKGSGRPDPMPRLKECFTSVVVQARESLRPKRILIGGRSMGGRAASMMAAEGFESDGLLLLAYPLHPAGQPEKLRNAHLAQIAIPVLCINGTRDALCRQDLMEHAIAGLSERWTMHWLEGADHSFHVLKSSGRTDADVLGEIGGAVADWSAQCLGSG